MAFSLHSSMNYVDSPRYIRQMQTSIVHHQIVSIHQSEKLKCIDGAGVGASAAELRDYKQNGLKGVEALPQEGKLSVHMLTDKADIAGFADTAGSTDQLVALHTQNCIQVCRVNQVLQQENKVLVEGYCWQSEQGGHPAPKTNKNEKQAKT